ncbi:MAG: uracil-DNA glycosylase [Burkholderiales bacterium]|nr:uracil-DNA glycosylase [Phycisphaerae bacterium]
MADESQKTPIERIRARARLALRAERAMGIASLAVLIPDPVPEAANLRGPGPQEIQASAPATRTDATISRVTRPAPASPVRAPGVISPISAPAIPNEPFTAPVLPREARVLALRQMDEQEVSICRICRLHETRTRTVFGEGDPEARIMFIGEGPGENEDLLGRPFVGKAGQLLDKMIAAMGLSREKVFICNIVKCRPPNNREPSPDETASCTPYLLRQIEIVRPEVIVTLGRPASQYLLQTKNSMSKLRGNWHSWRGIRVMPTYHPAYVLRQYTPETREAVWSDLKHVLVALNLPVPRAKSD